MLVVCTEEQYKMIDTKNEYIFTNTYPNMLRYYRNSANTAPIVVGFTHDLYISVSFPEVSHVIILRKFEDPNDIIQAAFRGLTYSGPQKKTSKVYCINADHIAIIQSYLNK